MRLTLVVDPSENMRVMKRAAGERENKKKESIRKMTVSCTL